MSGDYANPSKQKVEDIFSLFHQDGIDTVSYTTFYDEFLDTDKLQKSWPVVESGLGEYGLSCKLDLVKGNMYVSTTRATEDRHIIFKAMDVLRLLSRSVPVHWAIQVLDCSVQHEIIKIANREGGLCKLFGINKDQFIARRILLAGVLKELNDLTGCGIFLKGDTVAVIGSLRGIKMISKIVEGCIAHGVPPAPLVRRIRKKIQPMKDARVKMTTEVMMSFEALRIRKKAQPMKDETVKMTSQVMQSLEAMCV
ncbi:KRR1 small subunit processome component homolog [Argentina anserina]|uniref:KRR1 small subunit processome component homolog n=1 Tax=Argentina anserina TaxID=57926 RepID=UPI0021765362|nr:KRR1 small subunit processome component homolog [Potentilla anserina]